MTNPDWHIFKGDGQIDEARIDELKPPPKWRDFSGMARAAEQDDPDTYRGEKYQADEREIEMVNAALYLRRPLLVTGDPGCGKSSLAYAVARELKLGAVLHWPITTRATLQDGLYSYDAIGRLQDSQLRSTRNGSSSGEGASADMPAFDTPALKRAEDIGNYIRLGPLGTALMPADKPRVLLIDEIDKSDIDLPNDLLNVFEEGRFPIPELVRRGKGLPPVQVFPHDGKERSARITDGEVVCTAFPFILLTSNGERELPAPFIRRCIRLDIKQPDEDKLEQIVNAHFGTADEQGMTVRKDLIKAFLDRQKQGDSMATDQLLNAVHLSINGVYQDNWDGLVADVLRPINK